MRAKVCLASGNIVNETEKAVLIDFGRGERWLPKSQIELENPIDKTSVSGSITMPIWLARQLGLWGYDNDGRPVSELVE